MDAYYHAPENEEVVVEPAPEYLERLAEAGRDTYIVAVLEACSRSELGGTLGWKSCGQVRL